MIHEKNSLFVDLYKFEGFIKCESNKHVDWLFYLCFSNIWYLIIQ